MDDFPIWLKAVVCLLVGGTVLYTAGMMIYSIVGRNPVLE